MCLFGTLLDSIPSLHSLAFGRSNVAPFFFFGQHVAPNFVTLHSAHSYPLSYHGLAFFAWPSGPPTNSKVFFYIPPPKKKQSEGMEAY